MDGTGKSNPDCLATLMGLEGERKSYSEIENVFQYLFSPRVTLCGGMESLINQR